MPFSLMARLGLDQSGLISGLTQAQARVAQFGGQMNAHMGSQLGALKNRFAAAFGTGALIAFGQRIVEHGGKMHDLALQTGLVVEQVQALAYAAAQTNIPMETVVNALRDLTTRATRARGGDAGLLGYFRELGVSVEDLRSKNTEKLFYQIAESIRSAEDPASKLNALIKTMGENGYKLVPAMRTGLGQLAEDFERIGAAMNPQVIKELKALGDDATNIGSVLKALGGRAIAQTKTSGGLIASLLAMPLASLFGKERAEEQTNRAADSLLALLNVLGKGRPEHEKTTAELRQRLTEAQTARAARDGATQALRTYEGRRADGMWEADQARKKKRTGMDMTHDSLARIGGFSQADARTQLGLEMLKEVKKIAKWIEQGGFGEKEIW